MLKHQLCWCDFLFDFFWCFSGRRKREKRWLSYLCKKRFHMWGRNAAAVSCHTTYWVLYIKWPITSVRGKIKVILSSTPLTFCFSLSLSVVTDGAQRSVSCHPGLIWPMTALRRQLSPAEQTSCSWLRFLLGLGRLMRTLSDQCLQPDTNLAASTLIQPFRTCSQDERPTASSNIVTGDGRSYCVLFQASE